MVQQSLGATAGGRREEHEEHEEEHWPEDRRGSEPLQVTDHQLLDAGVRRLDRLAKLLQTLKGEGTERFQSQVLRRRWSLNSPLLTFTVSWFMRRAWSSGLERMKKQLKQFLTHCYHPQDGPGNTVQPWRQQRRFAFHLDCPHSRSSRNSSWTWVLVFFSWEHRRHDPEYGGPEVPITLTQTHVKTRMKVNKAKLKNIIFWKSKQNSGDWNVNKKIQKKGVSIS